MSDTTATRDWLGKTEIVPGIVIHMDYQMLYGDPLVVRTDPGEFSPGTFIKPRTFVCVATDGDTSWWTPTTTTPRSAKYDRLPLLQEWRTGGASQWTGVDQFLLDGASIVQGPAASFIRASHAERTGTHNRARLAVDGLVAIAGEIRAQAGRRAVPVRVIVPGIDAGLSP